MATPKFLEDALKFGINLGLERMNELLARLGNPQDSLNVVHIAGTNGKGSVTSFTSTILASHGLKVGIFTSPFLERFSERMRILDGEKGLAKYEADDSYGEISNDDLDRISALVKNASDSMVEEGFEHPTEFELVTAICFIWFAEKNVDVAVLETGLGGRLDSTNVCKSPLCTAITAIGYDHTDRLGETIEEITSEKAGIFKKGVKAFCFEPEYMILDSDDKAKVRDVLCSKANEVNCPIVFVGKNPKEADITYNNSGHMEFTIGDSRYETRLLGEHQVQNCYLAISIAEYVIRQKFNLECTSESLVEAVSRTFWKGRIECLSRKPLVILDGGHNVQGATSLASTFVAIGSGELVNSKVRVVLGAMRDKDFEEMVRVYKQKGLRIYEAYCARVDNPRTMEPVEVSNTIKLVYNDEVHTLLYEDAKDAVRDAITSSAKDNMPLLITGSLYLLGQIRGVAIETLAQEGETDV